MARMNWSKARVSRLPHDSMRPNGGWRKREKDRLADLPEVRSFEGLARVSRGRGSDDADEREAAAAARRGESVAGKLGPRAAARAYLLRVAEDQEKRIRARNSNRLLQAIRRRDEDDALRG